MLTKNLKRPSTKPTGTADPDEIARFTAVADAWWDPHGAFKLVHAFNKVRVEHLWRCLPRLLDRDPSAVQPLAGLKIIDVGCGAGIVTEPLSRLGAEMTGIDATERNVEIAMHHAAMTQAPVRYRHILPEELLAEEEVSFDIVMSLEVVEHVADLSAFLGALADLTKPGGLLVIGTMNRTIRSWLQAILGAEYILGWFPRGTHDWQKFVRPSELDRALTPKGFSMVDGCGVAPSLPSMRWGITRDQSVNYLRFYRRDDSDRASVAGRC
ncbi:MAG TPA: bifunctional 2-polyprenyl-6-hydroxyphenol methylase/3-demethylubiquinol 3-O-methyltransferase UbiG [Terriglobales bacterium]|nr:bifunctional 2-polyprenyl-6-hydroxyphenol methylase/3-demethylubiquinol 3-O-methyltransferase UbiG [Terriglobales bacterium]